MPRVRHLHALTQKKLLSLHLVTIDGNNSIIEEIRELKNVPRVGFYYLERIGLGLFSKTFKFTLSIKKVSKFRIIQLQREDID